jgi:hypothetical protein
MQCKEAAVKYIKMGSTYIPYEAVEFIEIDPGAGNPSIGVGLCSGRTFTKRVTHSTYTDVEKLLEPYVRMDLNGVGL